MAGSGIVEFKLDWAATKSFSIGDVLLSDEFSAGGHVWRVRCYPHGDKADDNGAYLSVFLQLMSESENIKAIFEVFLMRRDGSLSVSHVDRCVKVYPLPEGFQAWGFAGFVKRADLESLEYIKDGHVRFMFGVIVLLAAADMFQLDRLKLMCSQKLWERVSPENVATVLGCAETHSCQS